uniref:AlNc14C514G12015 protein n=1 Tax=Albugo laibachii Nc14 TaxID=890382 RepID=F0X0S1_9STRA|nr:AlNc14C514G12015 [Albugo laibachii Nc14]|eukprot:CCA27365.1 AlNc14C514G12015 [Albugo laibachii Nc14]
MFESMACSFRCHIDESKWAIRQSNRLQSSVTYNLEYFPSAIKEKVSQKKCNHNHYPSLELLDKKKKSWIKNDRALCRYCVLVPHTARSRDKTRACVTEWHVGVQKEMSWEAAMC